MSNEPDKVNSGALATIIVIVAFATLAVALVVTALVRDETKRLRADGDQKQERSFRELRAAQQSKNNEGAAWADKEAGLASIPLKSAQALVLEAIRTNPLALSPGNKPKEEEEEEEGSEEAEGAEADGEEAEGAEADGEEADAEEGSEAKEKEAPAPAPKALAPAPAPAPKVPAPKAPVAPAPAPAPGGPAQ